MPSKIVKTRHPKTEKALTLKYAVIDIRYSEMGYRAQLVPEYEYRNIIPYHTVEASTIEQALDSLESKI